MLWYPIRTLTKHTHKHTLTLTFALQDLEMGAKCCEKAYKWLTDMEDDLACKATYLGMALFLRFLCEHRLLQIQISNEVGTAGCNKMRVRLLCFTVLLHAVFQYKCTV